MRVDKFDGKMHFPGWKRRFQNMMEIMDERYEKYFEYFESFKTPITDDDFKGESGEIHEPAVILSKNLKRYLSNHCDCSIDMVLQPETTKHGFEMWRRLRDHYEPRYVMIAVGRLSKAMTF